MVTTKYIYKSTVITKEYQSAIAFKLFGTFV